MQNVNTMPVGVENTPGNDFDQGRASSLETIASAWKVAEDRGCRAENEGETSKEFKLLLVPE